MRTVRNSHGPFQERPYFKLQEIEKICTTELRAVNLYPSDPEPIRIDRFIEKRFGISPTYGQLPVGVLGYTEFGKNGVTDIVVSVALEAEEGTPEERRLRTTLAHEAGHGLMHAYLFAMGEKPASLFNDSDNTPTILCRDVAGETGDKNGYDGRWWEFQANKAIGGLLMPKRLVEKAIQEFTEPVGSMGQVTVPAEKKDRAVQVLTKVFNVNPVVIRIRLRDLFPDQNNRQLPL